MELTPSTGSPSRSEEEDVNANKRELRLSGSCVRRRGGVSARGNNVLSYSHAQSTREQDCSTTECVNGVESGYGGAHVNDVGYDREDETLG